MSWGDGIFFGIFVVGLIVLGVFLARDKAAEHRRVEAMCRSAYAEARTAHDSLSIARLNYTCDQMIGMR